MQAVWETHLLLQIALLETQVDKPHIGRPCMQPAVACRRVTPVAHIMLLASCISRVRPGSGVLQVSRVLYPGLPDHPYFPRVQKLFGSQAGGVVSFELTGGAPAAEMMFQVCTCVHLPSCHCWHVPGSAQESEASSC